MVCGVPSLPSRLVLYLRLSGAGSREVRGARGAAGGAVLGGGDHHHHQGEAGGEAKGERASPQQVRAGPLPPRGSFPGGAAWLQPCPADLALCARCGGVM